MKKKWVVIRIDLEDSEDSQIDFYEATDEDSLYDVVLDDYIGGGEEDPMGEDIKQWFQDSWGLSILFKEVE